MGKNVISLRSIIAAIGAVAILSIITAVPVLARSAQETITVSFNNIRISVDGQIAQTEFEPFIFQGRTYLPVRDVANAMGFGVAWDEAANTVRLTAGAANPQQFTPAGGSVRQQAVVVNFNNIRISVNNQIVQTEFEPFIFQGRTYLPVRDVANAMGFGVAWDEAANTVRLTSGSSTAQAGNITIPANITPRPPARAGGPSNPAVSARRAVELARDHLISIGVTSARFDYVYMDIERGTWVWSVEFDGQGRSFEFYVDVQTGAFLQAPQGTGNTSAVTATPSPQPTNPPATTSGQGSRPQNPNISLQRAIEIAEADLVRRGITANFHSNSGMSWERGQWVWELEF
ncbi:MAG: stalk domain-containing protein, partial [Defluviitaleaceae bacterium]|nr:stalk domain-containing protein [Defluviitaleaceae bacterium]